MEVEAFEIALEGPFANELVVRPITVYTRKKEAEEAALDIVKKNPNLKFKPIT